MKKSMLLVLSSFAVATCLSSAAIAGSGGTCVDVSAAAGGSGAAANLLLIAAGEPVCD